MVLPPGHFTGVLVGPWQGFVTVLVTLLLGWFSGGPNAVIENGQVMSSVLLAWGTLRCPGCLAARSIGSGVDLEQLPSLPWYHRGTA